MSDVVNNSNIDCLQGNTTDIYHPHLRFGWYRSYCPEGSQYYLNLPRAWCSFVANITYKKTKTIRYWRPFVTSAPLSCHAGSRETTISELCEECTVANEIDYAWSSIHDNGQGVTACDVWLLQCESNENFLKISWNIYMGGLLKSVTFFDSHCTAHSPGKKGNCTVSGVPGLLGSITTPPPPPKKRRENVISLALHTVAYGGGGHLGPSLRSID